MPNWCMNNLTVSHDDPAKLQEFVDAYNSGKTCQHFLPVPEGYYDDKGPFPRWYEWCLQNWGTKWDIGKQEYTDPAVIEDGNVSISFNSAWSPPTQFYEHLHDEHGYGIKASYWEPGMAFCGWWTDGDDDYYEYVDKDEIPHGLWDEFGMEDFFEMNEEEV